MSYLSILQIRIEIKVYTSYYLLTDLKIQQLNLEKCKDGV